jgi:hypothetical protein
MNCNTLITKLKKNNIKNKEKENSSIYSNLKQNKQINLNLKQIKSLSSIKGPENIKKKINKQTSIYKSYTSNKIKDQDINLYDDKVLNNDDDLIITIYKNTKSYLNVKKGARISTSKSSTSIPLINSSNLNKSNNNDIQSNKNNNNYINNEEIKVFDNLLQDNDNDNRKTKMKNVNGVNISSKLIDVLDIFNRVEKIKQSNENILNKKIIISLNTKHPKLKNKYPTIFNILFPFFKSSNI